MKFHFLMIMVTGLLCLSVTPSFAIYTWTDENGVKHFSDTQPEGDYENIGHTDTSASTQSSPQTMKMPVNGSCDENYSLMDGVCVHILSANPDGSQMKAAISEFKRTGNIPSSSVNDSHGKEAGDQCEKARQKLERYLRDGVMGYSPITGQLQKMTGEAAESAIESARDDVDILCND